MGTWRDRTAAEKTWAEKMQFAQCKCGHPNTIHAGGIGDCAFLFGDIDKVRCDCQEFTEPEPASAFQKAKQDMGR